LEVVEGETGMSLAVEELEFAGMIGSKEGKGAALVVGRGVEKEVGAVEVLGVGGSKIVDSYSRQERTASQPSLDALSVRRKGKARASTY
jgi:hypothetical protein